MVECSLYKVYQFINPRREAVILSIANNYMMLYYLDTKTIETMDYTYFNTVCLGYATWYEPVKVPDSVRILYG